MLTLDDVTDDATARQWFREQWRRPEFVAEMLGWYQQEALAGLLRYPSLGAECTAHIFSTPCGTYVDIFTALKSAGFLPEGTVKKLFERGRLRECGDAFVSLLGHPVTIWTARQAIDRAQRIVAWKYQQEKKAKCKI